MRLVRRSKSEAPPLRKGAVELFCYELADTGIVLREKMIKA